MPIYKVEMLVSFVGEIEAASEAEAEQLAIYDETCQYNGVDSVEIDEIEIEEEEEEEGEN